MNHLRSVNSKLSSKLITYNQLRTMSGGQLGDGAGKGGGGGGSIREAGGSFGRMEAAREEQYFRQKQGEQLATLKDHLVEEISFHEEQVKRHQEAINRHNESIKKLENN